MPDEPNSDLPTATTAAGPVRVLIVEDNPTNHMVLQRMLQRLGCATDHAVDGAVAVDKVGDGDYDLVLMDCAMPTMDGFEATRRIRQLESPQRDVTVVATTAYVTVDDERRCFEAGMNQFLPKPLSRAALDALLRATVPDFARRTRSDA